MGQITSFDNDKSKYSQNELKATQISKNTFQSDTDLKQCPACYSTNPLKTNHNRWREKATRYLKDLGLEQWPEILIEILENTYLTSFDAIFQNEMFWVDTNYTKDLEKTREQSTNLFVDKIESCRSNSSPAIKNVSFPDTARFHLQVSHDVQSEPVPKTLPHSLYKDKLIKWENSQTNVELPQINIKVPLINGLDGRNINNIADLCQAVNKYRAVTHLIETHIQQREHVIYHLMAQFQEYFVGRYGINQEEMSFQKKENLSNAATLDLQQFILVLYEIINEFYDLENLSLGYEEGQEMLFNNNNMLNFATSLIFKPKIHDIVFGLYNNQAQAFKQAYCKSLKKCYSLEPQDLGVFDKYCLNEKTVEVIMRDDNSLAKAIKAYYQDKIYNPYEKAIIKLQKLNKKSSPVQKLQIIVKTAELVNLSIQNFYQNYGAEIQEKLNGDEIFPIFLYLVAKSQIEDIITHCKIIDKFSTSNILSSMSGYYALTLEACVNYISEFDFAEKTITTQSERNIA